MITVCSIRGDPASSLIHQALADSSNVEEKIDVRFAGSLLTLKYPSLGRDTGASR